MANHNFFSHENLQGQGPCERLQQAGINWYICGENTFCIPSVKTYHYINGIEVGRDYYTMEQVAEEAVNGWMSSPGHRENILNPQYTYSGLGVARGMQNGQDSFLLTQDFVTP
jgi:uncharacterized protein YkwD